MVGTVITCRNVVVMRLKSQCNHNTIKTHESIDSNTNESIQSRGMYSLCKNSDFLLCYLEKAEDFSQISGTEVALMWDIPIAHKLFLTTKIIGSFQRAAMFMDSKNYP